MSILVVGKNSFIARNLSTFDATRSWTFLSHEEAFDQRKWPQDLSVIINFAFHPNFFSAAYSEEMDIDLKLSNLIRNNPEVHYIMISSRAVYGESQGCEDEELFPSNYYGCNKSIVEKNIVKALGEGRVSILRCSNVFGFQLDRDRFVSRALTSLRDSNEIRLNISANTKKDFLYVESFSQIIIDFLQIHPAGIFNVGSGISVTCRDISNWLINGYGNGRLIEDSDEISGEFYMDISKLKSKIPVADVTLLDIKDRCTSLGKQLRLVSCCD